MAESTGASAPNSNPFAAGSAFGPSTFANFGGSVSDLYAASGLRSRAKGNRIEAEEYGLAADLADQNALFAKESADIKEFQTERDIFHTVGKQQAGVATSGFAEAGTALDLLRDSATQGELQKAVLRQQGLIEEAGFQEQAKSFRLMQAAANEAATASDKAAQGAGFSAMIKGAAAGATAGSVAGPWGAAAGAVAGAGIAYFGSK